MNPILKACLLALPLLSTGPALAQEPPFDTGMIPVPVTLLPDDDAKALVVLLSDGAGWQAGDQAEAERLQGNGAIVIGIDTPKYLTSLATDQGDCIYMVSDIEALSHQLQRKAGNAAFLPPIIAGRGEGGALALAILAQTPKATIGQTLALDPQAGIPLAKQLCTPAEKTKAGDRMQYALTYGDLPDPATVLVSDTAPRDGLDHVQSLIASHPDIDLRDVTDAADTTFSATLDELIAVQSQTDNPLGMPLTILDATPSSDTMAVIYSGDGGWRDIDQKLGGFLQADGVPVIGVDALRYFWQERSPEQTAKDLSQIIATYRERFGVKNVVLIGYSFGADILPATYNRLPPADKAVVTQLSLLALSHKADFEIAVTGWLGMAGTGRHGDPVEALKTVEPAKIQCIYGLAETASACPAVAAIRGAQIIARPGGHHFDGNYKLLSDLILKRLGSS